MATGTKAHADARMSATYRACGVPMLDESGVTGVKRGISARRSHLCTSGKPRSRRAGTCR